MQFDLGTIVPGATSGTDLANLLMNWRDALHTLHRGASRPTYAQGGMLWVQEVNASLWLVMLYTGSIDIQVAAFDPTNGVLNLTVSGATFATIPQLPGVNPDSDNDAVRKAYVDELIEAMVPKNGGTMTGPLVLPAVNPNGANQAARKAYVDGLAPAAKISVQTGSWAGSFDLLEGTPTTFFDLMLPDNTAHVLGSGWVNGNQVAGGGVNAVFQAVLLNDALGVVATNFFALVSNTGTETPWFNSGGRTGFNNITSGNTGWRVRYQAYKDTSAGPLNLLGWEVSIMVVRR